jgi:hypothetical protein
MSNYQNGKIYKIVCNITKEIYVGSTTLSLEERLRQHTSDYNRYLNNKRDFVSSFVIIERGNYKIVLLENYPCETREELLIRERYYFDTLNCINKCRPILTTKEQCDEKKDYNKQYYIENRDEIKDQNKQYYIENREEIIEKQKQYRIENREELKDQKKQYRIENREKLIEKQKQYYIENREEIIEQKKQYYIENSEEKKEYSKQYRIENRDKITELFNCECGVKYQKCSKSKHFKTKRHQNYLQQPSIN